MRKVVPAGSNEHNYRHDDGAADGSTRCDCDLVHVGRGRGYRSHLTALGVRHGVRRNVNFLERYDAHNDAFRRRDVFDFELTLAGL